MAIVVDLDVQLAIRKMSLTQLASRVGITIANLSVLKNSRARAVRLTTLDAICRELRCQPGDLLRWVPDVVDAPPSPEALTTDSVVGGAA